MNNELPDEIYVRAVTKKTLSAVRPDSPIAQINWDGKLKRTVYVRKDMVTQPVNIDALKREYPAGHRGNNIPTCFCEQCLYVFNWNKYLDLFNKFGLFNQYNPAVPQPPTKGD